MQIKERVESVLSKYPIAKQITDDKNFRSIIFAVFSLIFSLLYAFYNGALGIISRSWWFGASCFYHLLLAILRFAVITQRNKNSAGIMCFAGSLLSVMSLALTGILYMSLLQDRATAYGEITMITIATYTFSKLITAIVKAIKRNKNKSPVHITLRTVRYAEIAVAIFTMQKSMLVSFGELNQGSILIFNAGTGSVMCVFAAVLGILLIINGIKKGRIYNEQNS